MRFLRLSPAIVAGALLIGPVARADDRAIAQKLFAEGRALMAEGKVAEACPKFAAAAQLSPTAGVRLNLADCYARLGKTAAAWAKADEALAIAERAGDSAAARLAHDRLAALQPDLDYLTISVARESTVEGLEVTLDGEKIPGAAWGTALPIDPGEHEVAVQAPGHKPWSTKTTVTGKAQRSNIAVPALVAEETTEPPVPTAAPQPARPQVETPTVAVQPVTDGDRGRGLAHALGLVGAGLGFVGLGVGTAFALEASSKKSQYQQEQLDGHCVTEGCVSLSKDAVSAANASTVAFLVGGALAAAGALVWFTAPADEGRTVGVVPAAGPQSLGAVVSGTW
jgi:hypothetical protein